MKYYAFIDENEIIGKGQAESDYINVEITEEVYNNLADYIYVSGEVVINPNLDEIRLQEAKDSKYQEALIGAKAFIENGAVYQFDENNSIEATDGNIGKMTAYALAFQTGTVDKVYWTSKEDNVLELSAEDILTILTGLGTIQSEIWNVKFVTYKAAIEQATTVEEVEAIEINYETEGE